MRKRIRPFLIVLATSGLVAGTWLVWQLRTSQDTVPGNAPETRATTIEEIAKLPDIAATRFVNASHTTSYTGAATCAECHPDEHHSYLQTPHSRALGDIDLETESGDVEFTHLRSNRKYEVHRKGDQIWHRETLLADDGNHLLLSDYPVHLAIGSGHHSRSYLVETDGFLLESPLTWYASKQMWALSPGYDVPVPPGFQRVVDIGCVLCHAGQVEPIEGNRFRVKIHDHTISCENCHGPGSLHVARHKSETSNVDGDDLTIVNPAHLTRSESEAICAQCHLRGDASVVLRGRSIQDFRPGLRLNDFRADYVLERPGKSMTVVGHVEQMRLSRCHQETETLTCTTCHDPHDQPSAPQRVEHFRQKCLACHTVDACGLELDQRLAREQDDNCMACHMPQGSTDIPHFAFTHHRIGLHESSETDGDANPAAIGRLVPVHDLSHLPQLEQQRCLGLAYLEFSDKQASPLAHDAYRVRAIRLLEEVSQAGLRDGDVEAALARIYWEQGKLERAVLFASESLKSKGTSGAVANALFVLGDSYLALNQPIRAQGFLEKLVRQRRQSEDWVLLGLCQRSTGKLDQAVFSLGRAVEISPSRVDARMILAEIHEVRGETVAAARHRRAISLLSRKMKQSPAVSGPDRSD